MRLHAAVIGCIIGVALVVIVLLVVGLVRLEAVASHANKRATENVEVICEAINEGRRYSRAHVQGYQLGKLPCKELVLKTEAASR